ncbi:DNA recombination protein RmuC [bacterium]|nr:DNA recombination protein RmuC [bacterium]
MSEVVFIIVGLAIGGAIAWFWMRQQIQEKSQELSGLRLDLEAIREEKVRAETRLEEAQKKLDEQKKLVEETTGRLKDTFSALSQDALKSNNQMFLDLAKKTLENLVTEAKGDLGKRQEAIDGIVKPLKESLTRYETQIREMESSRQQAYGGLKKHLEELAATHLHLQKETTALVTALKRPEVRGRWGEITLKRVVEVAGMSGHCDFVEQPSVSTEEGTKRPDLIVQLPQGRTVVIDAKAPLKAYMEAMEADSEEERKRGISRHARAVRDHMKLLGQKAYWNQFNPTPDFVVLFLPGESFFSAALEQDRSLIEDGIRSRVILATPTTLIALLRTVAYGWRQQQVTENSRQIWEAGVQLFDRVCKFGEHLGRIGDGLGKAASSYNAALVSFEHRVRPGAQKLKELGAAAPEKELPDIEPVETSLRELPEKSPQRHLRHGED